MIFLHSADDPHLLSPVIQNSMRCSTYPAGAFPIPSRYHGLQRLPPPLRIGFESALTIAGATDCDGGKPSRWVPESCRVSAEIAKADSTTRDIGKLDSSPR